MNGIIYIIATVLVIMWLIGLVGFHAEKLIHLLLILAVIMVTSDLIVGRRK